MAISNEIFMIGIAYLLIIILTLRTQGYLKYLLLFAIGTLTFTITGVPVAISWILSILPLVLILHDWLTSPAK